VDGADADALDERARGRNAWPVRRFALGAEPEDLSDVTTATERIAMMWPLALEAWNLAGLPIPDSTREAAPIRHVRRTDDLADIERLTGGGEG